MSPILGIYASQISGHLAPPDTGAYYPLSSITVPSAGTSSITFSSIPSTYTHLQIRIMGRSDRATTTDVVKLNFNSDSGANYTEHDLYGDGSSVNAGGYTGLTSANAYRIAGGNAGNNIQGAIIIDILDYANTNKYKTLRSLGGVDLNGSGQVWLNSSLWLNTSAISNIVLTSVGTLQQYSSFALYGIKGV